MSDYTHEVTTRFWSKVAKNHCWEWRGTILNSGYGQISVRGKRLRAHRVAWELANGAIPSGSLVCHRCDNPACVRPDHLYLGTHEDNMRDKRIRRRVPVGWKTHCKRGHAYTTENTYIKSDGCRQCRSCGRERALARRQNRVFV